MKKIFSLFLALTLIVTTFTFVAPTAYADGETNENLASNVSFSVNANTTEEGAAYEEIDDYYGKKAVHITRAQAKNTFFQFNVDTSAIAETDYVVIDVPLAFEDSVYSLQVQAGPSKVSTVKTLTIENTYGTNESNLIQSEDVNYNGWNNLKFVYQNKEGETGYIYFNGVCVATVTVGATADYKVFRLPISAPSKATSENLWVATEEITAKKYSVLPALPIYEFDKENEGKAKSDIIANVNDDGTEEYVGGVFGREATDMSWYIQRDGSNRARIDGSLPVSLSGAVMENRDVIVEASIYYPTKGTRFDIEDSSGQFVRLFQAHLEYKKWTKIMVILNDNAGEKGTATIYLDGKLVGTKDLTKKISSSTSNALRIHFGGANVSEAYVNYLKVYHVPTGSVTGVEAAALTASTEGYAVDTKEKTITTSNKLDTMTAADLKEALNIAPSAKVRAYSDDEFKNLVTGNLDNGYNLVVESEGGIIQVFKLVYEAPQLLAITEDGVATFTPSENMNGVLVVCAYNDKGVLKKLDVKNVSGADTLASSFSGAYNYKAFVFNSLADTVPLCGSVSVK